MFLYSCILFFMEIPVFVNEVGNDLAQVAVDVALNYIRKNPSLGLSVELLTVEGNRTDSKGLLESCKFSTNM